MQLKDVYKGYKVARKSLKAYSIKMQYEIVFKVIGCSCYTCLPRTALAAAQTAPKTAAPGTGTGLLRWNNVYSRTHGQNNAQ